MFNRTTLTKSLVFLSAGFLGVLPLVFTFVNDELFEFPKLILVYLAATIIGLGWLASQLAWPKPDWRKLRWLSWGVVAFLVTQLISTGLSIHPYTSIFGYYSRFHGGLLSTIAYVSLFFVWSQVLTKRQARSLLWVVVAAGFVACLYALPEHFGLSPSCILTSGGTNWGVSCWIQDVQNRVFGTFGQPNWLAAYIVLTLPLALTGLVNRRSKLQFFGWSKDQLINYCLVLCLGLNFTVLLFTKSRSGFLALVVGLAIWVGLMTWRSWRQTVALRPWLKTTAVVMIIFLALAVVFGTPYSPSLSHWLTPSADQTPATTDQTELAPQTEALPPAGGTDSGVIRQIVWRGAWRVFWRYPIFGSGVETFAYSYYQDRPVAHNLVSEWDFLYNKAHNEILNYLATTGIVGTSAYILMLFSAGGTVVWWISHKPTATKTDTATDQTLTIGMVAGLCGLTVSNFFGFSTVAVSTVMYAFFSFIIVLSSHYPDDSQTKIEQKMTTISYLSFIILGLISLVLIGKIINYGRSDVLFARAKALFSAQSYQASIDTLIAATKFNGREAIYYDELSSQVAQLASGLEATGDSSGAAELASSAITASDIALKLNSRHINFYKTRARVFILLSPLDKAYLTQAVATTQQAIKLSPTDAKLTYTLARIYDLQNNSSASAEAAQDSIALKPNYADARIFLAQLREKQGDFQAAADEYQYILQNIAPGDLAVTQKLASISAKLKK